MENFKVSDLEKVIFDIEDCIQNADAHYQVWWGLRHNGYKDYLATMNDISYVDFFTAQYMLIFWVFLFPYLKYLIAVETFRELKNSRTYSRTAESRYW